MLTWSGIAVEFLLGGIFHVMIECSLLYVSEVQIGGDIAIVNTSVTEGKGISL